jgi:hypothetical protein
MVGIYELRRLFLMFTLFSIVAVAGVIAQEPTPAAPVAPTAAPTNQFNLSDIMIAPTRVVFDTKTRTAEIALINQSAKTFTYRVSFMHLRMTDTGGMIEINEPGAGELFADDLVRFTPKQVILEPKKTQIVRLQLRKPADLVEAEYRSQLLFRIVPPATTEAGATDDGGKGISIKLIPVYGISIPIIVRHGNLNSNVTIADTSIDPATETALPVLNLSLNRTGTMSVFGDISVEWAPVKGEPVIIGRITGISVYTPNTKRIVKVSLKMPKDTKLIGGKLHIRYVDPLIGDKGIIAEETIAVP